MIKADLQKNKLPAVPGVYFFLGKKKIGGVNGRDVLYIGKAGSLRDRVRSYFSKDIVDSRSPAISLMVESAKAIHFKETDSVLEALILEAQLIKKYHPKFNVREKDDRSFNYVAITAEPFPRVVIVRQREIMMKKFQAKTKYLFGPFPQGGTLRDALTLVRKIFPFRDTCTPFTELKDSTKAKPCFNRQIGLCPGVCTGEISQREYGKIVQNIRLFFEGKKATLLKKLEKEMAGAADRQEFERAGEIKKTIFALNHIQDISLIKDDMKVAGLARPFRIEGYDVAHLQGDDTVGVMTVVEDGELKKSDYRKFIIKQKAGGNDVAALREVLERRLAHGEWRAADLMVIDGGKAQKNTAERVLKEKGLTIPVVSVVKDEHHRPRDILGLKKYRETYEKEIILVNYESHRFAIGFHKKRRNKSFLG